MTSQFVHLRVHSAYSLAEGAIRIPALMKLCKEYNMPAVAVTDSNNMFGGMEFCSKAMDYGVQPIMATQVLISLQSEKVSNPLKMALIAQNEVGYRNLCYLLSLAYMDTECQHEPQILLSDLYENNDGIIALSGGIDGPLPSFLLAKQSKEAEQFVLDMKDKFGDRFYIELQRHDDPKEKQIEEELLDLAYDHNVPLVATNDCFFPHEGMHEAHDALLCIAEGRYVTEDDRRKVSKHHYFKSPDQMAKLFSDIPEAIENTVKIAKRCSWFLRFIDPILPPFDCGDGRTEAEEMEFQAKEGLKWRLETYVYPECENEEEKKAKEKEYFERLDFELEIITGMGFPGYFLIVADFIQWAKDNNIPVGPGRGSGAASIIAWSLKITDLDPIAYSLLFERFLNPERVSMPDFDIDFCQDRRDEVIQYVQEKYGSDRVAQIITFGKLQARAVVRDVGRVLQMSYGQVDRIAKLIPNNPANPMTLQEAIDSEADLREQRDNDESVAKLIDIALKLEGLYRHASTHAAGVVIGDRPLHELIPVYRDPRSPMPVTGFNMKFIEQAGLIKFDFLGLKTLTVLQKSVETVHEEENVDIDLLAIPVDDKPTFEMLGKGENTGVFQLESAGMRDAGRQMNLEQLEEIIALVALYRPGPMDNIPSYIACKHGDQEQDFMHPLLQPILEETFGIMIYQEQVMQAAQILAGYSLGGADLLRRAMGKKIKEEMDKQRQLFIDGSAKHHQVPEEQASAIFDQIAKFAGYGFNKAHAACYAFISYQTAYMKANYPVEFFTASMTLDMGNTDKLNIFKQELDRMGIVLLPPDVNHSYADFRVEHLEDGSKAIRYALGAIKGVGEVAMGALVAERDANGSYKDVFDLARRLDTKVMNKRQLENLVKAGAFDALFDNRAALFESVPTLVSYSSTLAEEKNSGQESLFGGADEQTNEDHLPKLVERNKWDILEQMQNEFAAIGFYLSAHPLDSEQEKLERKKIIQYGSLKDRIGSSTRVQLAGIVLKKQERTSAKGNRFAFVQLSDSSGAFEMVVFSDTLFAHRDLLTAGNAVIATVDVQMGGDDEEPRLSAQKFEPLDEMLEKMTEMVTVTIADQKALQTLSDTLNEQGEGRVGVRIIMDIPDVGTKATVDLGGAWNIPPACVRAIGVMDGVADVSDG